jgi:DNA-binding MarR family transcriptional regulator
MSESNSAVLEAPVVTEAPKVAAKPKAKPAGKKPAAKKPAAKKAPKSQMDPAERKDRDAAKEAGLSLVNYRILRSMTSGNSMTYRDIEKKTGYYSILTACLRKDHEGSLGADGYVREEMHDVDGRDVLHFVITAKGRKVFGK